MNNNIVVKSPNKPLLFRTTFRNCIYDSLIDRGWKETEGDDYDLHWCERDWMADVFDTIHLAPYQRVNHFRNQRELCRKDLMVKNLKRYKRELQKENLNEEAEQYCFWPLTYVLPGDYALFVEEFKRNPTSLWIMKPVGRSQGKGIFLFQHLKQIAKWKSESRYGNNPSNPKELQEAETYVVQRYISNPYLVSGRKFDIRMYALVTSYQPLVCWIHRAGFCRFSSIRYSSSANTLNDTTMHLTNVAIQKKVDSGNLENDHGGKWLMRDLKLYLMSRYGTAMVDRLFYDIQQTVIRCLLSVQGIMMNDKHCFELYGFDILFDDSFKVYVIEVNASPSMSANTAEDRELKTEVLGSAFDIVDLEGKMQGDEVRVGGFDLAYKGGPVSPEAAPGAGAQAAAGGAPPAQQYTTMLGCDVPKDVHVQRSNVKVEVPAGKSDKPPKGAQGRPSFGGGGGGTRPGPVGR